MGTPLFGAARYDDFQRKAATLPQRSIATVLDSLLGVEHTVANTIPRVKRCRPGNLQPADFTDLCGVG